MIRGGFSVLFLGRKGEMDAPKLAKETDPSLSHVLSPACWRWVDCPPRHVLCPVRSTYLCRHSPAHSVVGAVKLSLELVQFADSRSFRRTSATPTRKAPAVFPPEEKQYVGNFLKSPGSRVCCSSGAARDRWAVCVRCVLTPVRSRRC